MRILVIEDDKDLCSVIEYHLDREGYTADFCNDGGDASYYIDQEAHNIIILDRMLPERSGIDILSYMRSKGIQTPVIMTTALNGIGDKITGLDAGADDYLVKPYAMDELLARIRAVSRRQGTIDTNRRLTYSDITLDMANYTISGPAGSHTLSKREADLLEVLIRSPRQVMARSMLLARVWGPDAPVEDGNLDNYIHFLRRRLKSVGSKAKIRTARSIGYALEENE